MIREELLHRGAALSALAHAIVSLSIFLAFVCYAGGEGERYNNAVPVFFTTFLTIFSKNLKYSHLEAYSHAKLYIFSGLIAVHGLFIYLIWLHSISEYNTNFAQLSTSTIVFYAIPVLILTSSLLLETPDLDGGSPQFRATNQLFIPAFATVLIPIAAASMQYSLAMDHSLFFSSQHIIPLVILFYAPTIFVAIRLKWRNIEIREKYLQMSLYLMLSISLFLMHTYEVDFSARLLLFATVSLNLLGVLDVATRVIAKRWENARRPSELGGVSGDSNQHSGREGAELRTLSLGVAWSSSSALALCALLPLVLGHAAGQNWTTITAFMIVACSAIVSGLLPMVMPQSKNKYRLVLGFLMVLAVLGVPWGWGALALPDDTNFVFNGNGASSIVDENLGTLISAYGASLAFVTILYSTLLTSDAKKLVAKFDPEIARSTPEEFTRALRFVTVAITATVVINFVTLVASFWFDPAGVPVIVYGGLFSVAFAGIGGLLAIGTSIVITSWQK